VLSLTNMNLETLFVVLEVTIADMTTLGILL